MATRLSGATRWIDGVGLFTLSLARRSTDLAYMLANLAGGLFHLDRGRRRFLSLMLFQQIYFTASQALYLAIFVGAILGVLTVLPLATLGITDPGILAEVMATVLFHQVAPVIVALLVMGRSGTAITTELGEMHANQTIDALLAMGIEPHQFLVLPRLLGMFLSLLLLTLWADLGGILGAALYLAGTHGMEPAALLHACTATITPRDLALDTLMIAGFAANITLVYTHFGFHVWSYIDIARSLPRATVWSVVGCILITLFVALLRHG